MPKHRNLNIIFPEILSYLNSTGKTITNLAVESGIERTLLSHKLAGRTRILLDEALVIARIIGLPVEVVFQKANDQPVYYR